MRKAAWLVAVALLLSGPPALADKSDAVKSPLGYGSEGYDWYRMTPERIAILKLTGRADKGREAFRGCRGCHKADGEGLIDGTYPRLTGQHASVIIKQVTDVRAGIRANPKMEPFAADHAMSPQEIADIAVFLAAAETTKENGKGPDEETARGKALYDRHQCATCHGLRGEGDKSNAYPAVAAQHFGYLLREMEHIRDRTRGNSHPNMVRSVRSLSRRQLEEISNYLSRLPDFRRASQP
jgi:cytochrome c553